MTLRRRTRQRIGLLQDRHCRKQTPFTASTLPIRCVGGRDTHRGIRAILSRVSITSGISPSVLSTTNPMSSYQEVRFRNPAEACTAARSEHCSFACKMLCIYSAGTREQRDRDQIRRATYVFKYTFKYVFKYVFPYEHVAASGLRHVRAILPIHAASRTTRSATFL